MDPLKYYHLLIQKDIYWETIEKYIIGVGMGLMKFGTLKLIIKNFNNLLC